MSPAFQRQGLHALLLAGLLAGVAALARGPAFSEGGWGGLSTGAWFGLTIAVPVLHEVYVAFCWRAELHGRHLTRRLGRAAFWLYAALFLSFFAGRAASMAGLALASRDTLDQNLVWRMLLLGLLGAPVLWSLYSVVRHFGVLRALGRDHFDPAVRALPPVREGAFRYVPNAMYTLSFAAFWMPGLALGSRPALLAAAFTHAYIWVHYWCTEKPDLEFMHGTRS
ncbi:MAG: hypothetical protein DRQ55_11955 [Planctomycetota bacterium]|nr:MAG: hypothetical protein DRQ55_11955 [Planctomycetota bacterium]